MNKPNRLETGDRVKIIDRKSPYFGKTGVVRTLITIPTEIIKADSIPRGQYTMLLFKVKLEDTETPVDFTSSQLEKI